MAQRGGQPGNDNATRGRVWRDAINRALKRREESRADGVKELDKLADELIGLCYLKDLSALKELGDRLEGKAAQQLQLTGDEDNPVVVTSITRRVIMPGDVLPEEDNTAADDAEGISFF